MKGFVVYDIRGIFNSDFDKNDVYKFGCFIPELSDADKVLVGIDVREGRDEIFDYLLKGLTDRGVDVYEVGLAITLMVYYLVGKYSFKLSVQITASHNPKEYNGFKVSGEEVLQDIRCSKSVQEYLEKFDARVHTWRVGIAFASSRLKGIDEPYGGDLAGHYSFKDFYYSDSGIMAVLIVLGITAQFKEQEKSISDVMDEIKNLIVPYH
ncbi:MAG: hypothetical protein R6U04_11795 [Bacteroidales bacterium]